MPFEMAWMSALELALLKRPGVAHCLGGLPGLLTSMHAHYEYSCVSRLYEGPAEVSYGLSPLAKGCRLVG